MERHFESDFRNLKQQILAMGGLVERAIEEATKALIERKAENFEQVFEL
jgi:phosphate uptake regulator